MMAKHHREESSQLPIRMPKALRDALEEDAARSGVSVAEQVRYELMMNRGMWKQPTMPTQDRPKKGLS